MGQDRLFILPFAVLLFDVPMPPLAFLPLDAPPRAGELASTGGSC